MSWKLPWRPCYSAAGEYTGTMPWLFSYGTLRDPAVQRSTLGRVLPCEADELVGYQLTTVEVADAAFVALTGQAVHANVVCTGRAEHRVGGVALQVTDDDLARFDRYEAPARYERVITTLASGRAAWVFAFAG